MGSLILKKGNAPFIAYSISLCGGIPRVYELAFSSGILIKSNLAYGNRILRFHSQNTLKNSSQCFSFKDVEGIPFSSLTHGFIKHKDHFYYFVTYVLDLNILFDGDTFNDRNLYKENSFSICKPKFQKQKYLEVIGRHFYDTSKLLV